MKFGSHPVNLILRFLSELAALASMGYWAWTHFGVPLNYFLAFIIPLIAMIVWGVFAVPNDPSRSGKAPVPVAGIIRLIYELLFFTFAVWSSLNAGMVCLGILLAVLTITHYILSLDRIKWLLSQKVS
jgi:hypothetical protein